MLKLKPIETTQIHEDFYQEIIMTLKKYGNQLSQQEMLAIASQIVGKIIAAMDPEVMTSEKALAIVQSNLELGNQMMSLHLTRTKGSA